MTEIEQVMADAGGGDPLASAKKYVAQFRGFMIACERISQIESFERATQEAEDRLAGVRAEMADMRDRRDALAAQIREAIDAELAKKRGELEELLRQVEASRKSGDELKAQIERDTAKLEHLHREIAEAHGNFANIKGELVRLRNSLGPLQ
jgi:chromosome segregation ATPase